MKAIREKDKPLAINAECQRLRQRRQAHDLVRDGVDEALAQVNPFSFGFIFCVVF